MIITYLGNIKYIYQLIKKQLFNAILNSFKIWWLCPNLYPNL